MIQSTLVVQSNTLLTVYLKVIKKLKSLTKQERTLTERILTGDGKAAKMLVEANLKFVVRVCHNYKN